MTCTRRRFTLLLALLAAVAMLLGVEVGPAAAMADPTPAPSGNDGAPAQPGNEGGTPLLRDVLESTGRGYVEAKNAVDNSRKRQLELSLELQKVDERLAALGPEISEVAANAYRTGRIGPVTVLLNSSSPDNLLQRAEGLDVLAMHDNQKLRELNDALRQAQRAAEADGHHDETEARGRAGPATGRGQVDRGVRQRHVTGGQAGAAQPGRLLAQAVLQPERSHHVGLHHPADAARAEGDATSRVHPVRLVLPPERPLGASEGSGM